MEEPVAHMKILLIGTVVSSIRATFRRHEAEEDV
jgi:hypothetical protein